MTRWSSVRIAIPRWTIIVAILVSISQMGVARPDDPIQRFIAKCCLDCHGSKDPSGDLDLSSFRVTELDRADSKLEPSVWERVLRRLQSRPMPPPDSVRPSEPEYMNLISQCDIPAFGYHPRSGG
ncbi:MAG: c-type cytochrome domain-containing protein [Pirellula sp.]